jgi:hypothetical protein
MDETSGNEIPCHNPLLPHTLQTFVSQGDTHPPLSIPRYLIQENGKADIQELGFCLRKNGQNGGLAQKLPQNPNPVTWPSVLSNAARFSTGWAAEDSEINFQVGA